MLKFPRITSFAPRLRFGLVLGLAFSGFGFQSGCDTAGKPAPLDTSLPPGARGPFLVEVAESGLSFTHFNGMSGHRYFCETVGAGGALFDFDQDGDLDLYVVQGAPLGPDPPQFPPDPGHPPGDRLYRNLHRESGELKFIDATVDAGIESLGYGMGCAVGDIEGDGDLDLYVTQFGKDRLWLNQGDGTFRDGTAAAGLGDPRWTTSAAFLDPDRDGDLDLFVCTYVDFTLENHKPCYSETSAIDYCGPSSYRPLPDRFYRNLGDGTFEDDSAVSRIGSLEGAGLGVVVTDLDGDGRLDIYVANDGTPNRLWRNLGDGTFEDIALLAGCAYNRDGRAEASMGIEAADFDGDGDEDIFLTHLTDETNTIYRNDGTGTFDDASAASGLGVPSRAYTGFGTALLDLEHDGDLDLFIANGAVKTIEALAAAGDPYPLHLPNQLFRNRGDGTFEEVPSADEPILARSEVGRGVCSGDLDDDGATDIVLFNNSGIVRVYRGRTPLAAGWVGIDLRTADGRNPALGARVRLITAGGRTMERRVRVAASYLCAQDPRVIFGLGDGSDPPALIEILVPGGVVESFKELLVGRYHTLIIGTGTPSEKNE